MNYIWDIVEMERQTADNFVIVVHYTVFANDGDYTASAYGSLPFTKTTDNFISFEDLTKEEVVSWVKNKHGQEIEETLAKQIEIKKQPVTESGLPW